MANHKSAVKRAKQNKKRNERNRFYKTRIKNLTKAVLEAVEKKDKEAAIEAWKKANSYFHHCVSKGIIKKGNASRRVSRLHKKVNSL